MKKLLVMICVMFGCVFSTKASGGKSSKSVVTARAQHMSDQMIKQLRLNNFQSKKLREINLHVAEEITAIEMQYAGNQAKIDELSKRVYAERDKFLEDVLSTVQYNEYFGDRKTYSEEDKKYMASLLNRSNEGIAVAENASTNNASASVN
ncbi:hypothetical protein POKO110462_18420 [Pontibacter korlensis]|uniref:Uncharacterized protein n=1 Tax=Pontibacter korlensis TaxID=400092 RepID=A0A0E3ZGC8_9BACT|nr:hypothetical protein [Pontibacter korlensis]AKD04900.1 hypothetical protein PKOR_19625 [Pontibacter korlensis]